MNLSTKTRQYLWFIGRWCAGLGAALAVGGVIKLFFRAIGG